MFGFKKRRRNKIADKPFPPQWLDIIRANVPYYKKLPAEDKTELQKHIMIFIAEKKFDGNVYCAAEYIKMMEDGPAKFKKEGKELSDAKEDAKEDAKTDSGLNMEEDEGDKRTDQQKMADEIAPDEEYHYPGS